MPSVIDVSTPCGDRAAALAEAGVKAVIRYYSRDTLHPAKRLTRPEAVALSAAGLKLGVVHEARHGDDIKGFSAALGRLDADYACQYAGVIGQPSGSAIYFAVDFDADETQLHEAIIPYFQGVAEGAAAALRAYRIGVYGNGLVCAALLDAGLATLAWLSQSTGFRGHSAFLASKRWALNQRASAEVAGVACDPDDTNPIVPDFGAFPPDP